MKKRKNIFPVLLTMLLLVLSVSAVSLYDNAKENKPYRFKNIEKMYQDDFQYLTLDLAMQLDEAYSPLDTESLNVDQKRYLEKELNDCIYQTRSLVNTDSDFYYVAEDLETKKIITNLKEYSEATFDSSDYSYFVDLTYDEKGILKMEGDAQQDVFSNLNDIDILETFQGNDLAFTDVKVNNPTHVRIQYMISAHPTSVLGISGYVNSWEQYSPFAGIMLMILSAIVCAFILFYPIQYIETSGLFKKVKDWCFEWNVILWTTIVSLITLGVSTVVGNSMNGNFEQQFIDFGFSNATSLVYAMNFLMWLYALLSVAISTFLVKYIFVKGPISYLKEHSVFVSGIQYIARQLNVLEEIKLTEDIRKTLLKYLAIHGALVYVLCLIGSIDGMFALLMVVLYIGAMYFYIKKKMMKVQEDYNNLLAYIQGIVSEDFNREQKDLGVFDASKKELMQLSENFEFAVQEKVKSQKLKTELISNVSHDLKTPLTCIKNYITLLKEDSISEEERNHYLNQLNIYSNRLKNLIEDLFEISKVDSGNIQLNKQELDIVSLLEQVHLENEDVLDPKDLTVIKKYNVEKAYANLDSDKTYRIFENLFTNIGKYAMNHSRVYIGLQETEDEIHIEFSNISEVPMDFTSEEIVERFVRGDRSRSKQGSGLGLAIARSFTEAQGGSFTITIDCDLFKVHISLPKDSE